MIIVAVVSSKEELNMLNSNSFKNAQDIGFLPILIHPLHLQITIPRQYRSIALSDFGAYGEINVAKACEFIQSNEHIFHVDPDEFYSVKLLNEVKNFAEKLKEQEVGVIKARYYFKHKLLNGTPWGGTKEVIKIAKKEYFLQRIHVHQRLSNKQILVNTEEFICHYWAESFREIESKHKRYLAYEGALKASLYGSYSLFSSVSRLLRVHYGILARIRISDGLTGLILSVIFSKYAISAELKFRSWSKIKANG